MKILPPTRQWLPALLRSRAGTAVAIGVAVILSGTLALAFLSPATMRDDEGRSAAQAAAATIDLKACSELMLNRGDHRLHAKACANAPLKAGTTIRLGRPLARTDMPPRANRLTAADRAIVVPRTLRNSVWDVGVVPADAGSRPHGPETVVSGRPAPSKR